METDIGPENGLVLGEPNRSLNASGRLRQFWTLPAFARALNRTTRTIRLWEEAGLPRPRYSASSDDARLYSAEEIAAAVMIARVARPQENVTLFCARVRRAWQILAERKGMYRQPEWNADDPSTWVTEDEPWNAEPVTAEEAAEIAVAEVADPSESQAPEKATRPTRHTGITEGFATGSIELSRRPSPYEGIDPWSEDFRLMRLARE